MLVTRVASGSFTGATSRDLRNNQETGELALGTLTFGSGGSNGTAGTFTNVATTTSGNGSGATLTVVTNTDNGKILTSADALLSSITTNTSDANDNSYSTTPTTDGNGTGLVVTVTCLLYTSPSPRDGLLSRMPSSA